MKDCKDCEFFNGYDWEDGTPCCEYDGGYEKCPFNDESDIKNNGMKIEIDTGFMHDYIRHTLKNTIEHKAISIANDEVKKLITEELKQKVREEMELQIKDVVSESISEFMQREITVGGGWSEPERKLTREQYLAENIEKELKSQFKSDAMKSYAQKEVKSAIDKYDRTLRDEINAGIRTYFDAATREILTQNVVSMLMSNDTYKKLSNSMDTFLPSKAE
jgi:phage terminase small subunit